MKFNLSAFILVLSLLIVARFGDGQSGQIGMCNNQRPTINMDCPTNATQDIEYFCQINGSDPDGGTLIYGIDLPVYTHNANISQAGELRFRPNASNIGFFDIILLVFDDTPCSNNQDSTTLTLNITRVNHPPVLLFPIPNQTWQMNTTLSPFNLNYYFYDPDIDPLIF
ncbi:MAG: hypothetical protein HGA85_00450, partial [Nanoarchaeota archaeon]|nr:hypothetical protein [Nanoarchaeota archaeon]